MKLVHFTDFSGRGTISFIADKIVSFSENFHDENKTSIFVLSAGGEDNEYVVGDNYRQVVSIMEKI